VKAFCVHCSKILGHCFKPESLSGRQGLPLKSLRSIFLPLERPRFILQISQILLGGHTFKDKERKIYLANSSPFAKHYVGPDLNDSVGSREKYSATHPRSLSDASSQPSSSAWLTLPSQEPISTDMGSTGSGPSFRPSAERRRARPD